MTALLAAQVSCLGEEEEAGQSGKEGDQSFILRKHRRQWIDDLDGAGSLVLDSQAFE